jgi:hypothetical protein
MQGRKGNGAANEGYSCNQRMLVEGWREVWSTTPGTTDPKAVRLIPPLVPKPNLIFDLVFGAALRYCHARFQWLGGRPEYGSHEASADCRLWGSAAPGRRDGARQYFLRTSLWSADSTCVLPCHAPAAAQTIVHRHCCFADLDDQWGGPSWGRMACHHNNEGKPCLEGPFHQPCFLEWACCPVGSGVKNYNAVRISPLSLILRAIVLLPEASYCMRPRATTRCLCRVHFGACDLPLRHVCRRQNRR